MNGSDGHLTCNQCGAPLPRGQPGPCLGCLLALGLQTVPTANTFEPIISVGQQIGPYTLIGEIGEGGCGIVYLAEQSQPVRRQVALKVIKPGMDTRSVIARFEAEKQALALMEHPNIAKVFDAGTTSDGRPFFVMELVKGCKITEYCDEKKLTTEARLNLFVQVCHAVQHAHHKGVIHRDIKPSNIIVACDENGAGTPKIIDFGIAKATAGQQLTDATSFTAFEQFIGTPSYMSPEQAGFGALDIDTRSDIYSLGILLYELLAGRPPFDPQELRGRAVDEVFRIMREEEPPRPSTRLTTLTDHEQTFIAEQRGTESAALPKLLRRELDWIVMKAIEKDRSRRYDSAGHFADDVERFLRNEPVAARKPSSFYTLRKWVRRNRLLAFAGLVLMVAIAVSLAVIGWALIRQHQFEQAEYGAYRFRAEWFATMMRTRANQQVLREAIAQAFSISTNYDAEHSFVTGDGGWSYAASETPAGKRSDLNALHWHPTHYVRHVPNDDHNAPAHASVARYIERLYDFTYPNASHLFLSPGTNGEVAHAIWTAPSTGVYSITTEFRDCTANSAKVWVLHHTRESTTADLMQRELNVANPTAAFEAVLQLRAGEQLDFCAAGYSHSFNFDHPDFRSNAPGVSLRASISQYTLATNIADAVERVASGPVPARYAAVIHHIDFEAEPRIYSPTMAPRRKVSSGSGPLQLSNAGFERPWIFEDRWYNSYQYEPRDAFWTFRNRAGIAHNDSGFVYLPTHPAVPEGAQCAFLEGNASESGSMEQVVRGFQTNVRYELSFETSQRDIWPEQKFETARFNVFLDGQLLKTFQPASTNWEHVVLPLQTSAGAHLLRFESLRASHDVTALVDDIQISIRARK